MKKILTIFATFIVLAVFSQVPEKISYQSVIRNASNTLVANQPVGIKISILQATATGSSVYTETHTITTNANGLASLQIGGGTVVSGTFSSIDWANGPFFIKTETDPNGGSSYTITGTSQLLSVPYALYAKTAGSSTPGPQGASGKNTLVNTTTEPAGSNCAYGGTKIEFGLDANSNGILESSEINSALTKYVCNGLISLSHNNVSSISETININSTSASNVYLTTVDFSKTKYITITGNGNEGSIYFKDSNNNPVNVYYEFNQNKDWRYCGGCCGVVYHSTDFGSNISNYISMGLQFEANDCSKNTGFYYKIFNASSVSEVKIYYSINVSSSFSLRKFN